MGKKYIVCSDVHGRIDLLKKLLETYSTDEYFYCFVGDVNDYGDEYREISSSTQCLAIVISLVENGLGVLVQSNHQEKLTRFLNGNKIVPSHGLSNTIAELEDWSDEAKLGLKCWLGGRPLYYQFREDGKQYVVVHAYFDDYMLGKAHDANYLDNKKKQDTFKSNCIYGLVHEGERVRFWEGDYVDRKITKFHLISGHYHQTYNRKNFTMVDTDKREIVYYVPSENRVGRVN